MATGNAQSGSYTEQDVFWGELGGCMESLDAGVTCVVDHAHMNYGPGYCMLLLFLVVFSHLLCDSQCFLYPRRALVQLCFGKRTAPCQASICRLEL